MQHRRYRDEMERERPMNAVQDAQKLLQGQYPHAFVEYMSINPAKPGGIAVLVQNKALSDADWVAEEKIHGSNVSVILHQDRVLFAKRTGLLPDMENFFGFHVLHEQLQAQVKHVRTALQKLMAAEQKKRLQLLRQKEAGGTEVGAEQQGGDSDEGVLPDVPHVRIVGELFGGMLDHPEAPRCSATYMLGGVRRSVTKVQNEAFPQYSTSLHFCAYQINYRMSIPSMATTTTVHESVVPYDTALQIFSETPGLLYSKPLLRGKLQQIAALNTDFTTLVPMQLPGLPTGNAYLRNNRSEGLVFRCTLLGTDKARELGLVESQMLLKAKSPYFQELRHASEAGTARPDPMADTRVVALSRFGTAIPDIAAAFPPEWLPQARHLVDHVASSTRLGAVVSKIGPEAVLHMGKAGLAYLLAKDAIKDFLKGCEKSTLCCPLLVRREMARYVLFEAKKLVEESWPSLVEQAGGEDPNAAAASSPPSSSAGAASTSA